MTSRVTRYPLAVSWMVLLGACQVATITAPGVTPGVDAGMPPEETPEELFNRTVRPILVARCESCHAGDPSTPEFLAGDYYTSVIEWPSLVVPGSPAGSLLLTKGSHAGPAWTPDQATVVETWIIAEGDVDPGDLDAGPGSGPIESIAISVTVGDINRISLNSLGLTGSAIEFGAQVGAAGIRLTDITLVGGTGGVSISNSTFVMYDPDSTQILDGSPFYTSNVRLGEGDRMVLNAFWPLTEWPDGGTLAIRFSAIGQ